jgi:hypothetical protein
MKSINALKGLQSPGPDDLVAFERTFQEKFVQFFVCFRALGILCFAVGQTATLFGVNDFNGMGMPRFNEI